MLRPRNSMDLLSSASLSESMTSTRAAFRRLKSALFGGAFLFPMESRSPCCSTRSIPIGGITKEKQLHFLDLTERLFGLKTRRVLRLLNVVHGPTKALSLKALDRSTMR